LRARGSTLQAGETAMSATADKALDDTKLSRVHAGGRWLAVLASALALVAGQGPISVFAAGVFMKPVGEELGFGRGEISTAISVCNIMIAAAAPVFGRLIDRRGVRPPLLASIMLFALFTGAMSLLQPSFGLLLLLFGLAGFAGIGQNPTAYSKVLAGLFDRERGLAMGIALGGVGIGTALMPVVSGVLIASFGWRAGYVGLGLLIVILAFIPVALLLPEPAQESRAGEEALPGMTLSEALRGRKYWALAVAFFLAATAINGTLVHVVPLLTDRGIPAAIAVSTMSGAGLALIAGRILAGYVMDRVFAPYVAVFFFAGPILGLAVLGWNVPYVNPIVATILLGLGVGAEVDLMSFLITRYFGIRAFGALHGVMFASFVLGNAAGAAMLGWSFQLLKSYEFGFAAFEVLLLIACALLLTLGPYVYPPRTKGVETAR
jgi:MFS family permease